MKKTIKILTIGLLFIGMTAVVGCKKEDQINKNLWKKGGVWNIERYENNYSYGGYSDSYVIINAGTYEFKKDGTGKLTFIENGEVYTNLFKYENTENTLKLTYKEGQMYYEGDGETYTLDWEKNKVNLYSFTSDQGSYDEYIIDLKKK